MFAKRGTKYLVLAIAIFGFSLSCYASNPNEDLSQAIVALPSSFDPQRLLSTKEFLTFCLENPAQIYQDIFIEGKTLFQGINICSDRYALIKPILDSYQGVRFSVLDLGAAQGYFSFRIANDFPEAECAMIEHNNTEYDLHDRMLFQLCHLNHLPNVAFLHQKITVPLLSNLSQKEHFDIVLAFLVVHQIDPSLDGRKIILNDLLNMGDHVIIELSNDVARELRDYVKDELSQHENYDCSFLGEVNRNYDPTVAYEGWYPNGRGEFFWFRKKKFDSSLTGPSKKIKPSTFLEMNGIYPSLE